MKTPEALPVELRGGAFLHGEARRLGVRSSRMRARDLHHPFHAVHVSEAPLTVQALCEAFMVRMPEGAVFSHQTAAALLGIPLPPTVDQGRLHVCVAFPQSPPGGRGVAGHSLGTVTTASAGPFPVCSPAQVWCQLAGVLDRDDLVAAGDHLLGARKREPLAGHAELAELSSRLHRSKGTQSRAWALGRLRFGADSRPESLLRLLVERDGYRGLGVNEPVPVRGGRLLLHPDLSIPGKRVAIEYEGDGHRVDRRQWQADLERQSLFAAAGWRMLRVTSHDLFTAPQALLHRLHQLTDSPRM